MTRPIFGRDLRIVLRALIYILDHQMDRRSRGLALKHARQDLYCIGLAPLCRVAGLTRPPPVHPGLDIAFFQRNTGWAAINDDT